MAYPATVTTSLTTLAKLGKKVQGNVLTGFQKKSEEWNLVRRSASFAIHRSSLFSWSTIVPFGMPCSG